MEILIWLFQASLLCWVVLAIFGMVATVYFDIKASALDFINWLRRTP